MVRIAVVAIAFAVAVARGGAVEAAPSKCRDAKGGYTTCAAPGAKPAAAAAGQSSAIPMKRTSVPVRASASAHCRTGKACGAGCIPKDKVCHKG